MYTTTEKMIKLLNILFLLLGLIVYILVFLMCLPLIFSPLCPFGMGAYALFLYLFRAPTIELCNTI